MIVETARGPTVTEKADANVRATLFEAAGMRGEPPGGSRMEAPQVRAGSAPSGGHLRRSASLA